MAKLACPAGKEGLRQDILFLNHKLSKASNSPGQENVKTSLLVFVIKR